MRISLCVERRMAYASIKAISTLRVPEYASSISHHLLLEKLTDREPYGTGAAHDSSFFLRLSALTTPYFICPQACVVHPAFSHHLFVFIFFLITSWILLYCCYLLQNVRRPSRVVCILCMCSRFSAVPGALYSLRGCFYFAVTFPFSYSDRFRL